MLLWLFSLSKLIVNCFLFRKKEGALEVTARRRAEPQLNNAAVSIGREAIDRKNAFSSLATWRRGFEISKNSNFEAKKMP
jgi:hypothetical protein